MKNLFHKIFSSIILGFFVFMLCLVTFLLIRNLTTKHIEKKVYPKLDAKKNERGDYVVTKIVIRDRVDENKLVLFPFIFNYIAIIESIG